MSTRALTLNRKGMDSEGPWTRALTGNYLNVRVRGDHSRNAFLDLRITGVWNGELRGAPAEV